MQETYCNLQVAILSFNCPQKGRYSIFEIYLEANLADGAFFDEYLTFII